jgi:hypothetical protein
MIKSGSSKQRYWQAKVARFADKVLQTMRAAKGRKKVE